MTRQVFTSAMFSSTDCPTWTLLQDHTTGESLTLPDYIILLFMFLYMSTVVVKKNNIYSAEQGLDN